MKLYFWEDTFSIHLINNQLVLETFEVAKVGYVNDKVCIQKVNPIERYQNIIIKRVKTYKNKQI